MKEVKLEFTMSEREYDVFVDFIHHGMYDLERIMEHEQDDEKWEEMNRDIIAMNRILQGVKTQMKGGE